MNYRTPRSFASLFAASLLLAPAGIHAQAPHAIPSSTNWIGAWAASPVPTPNNKNLAAADVTLRQVVHVSMGGSSVRVTFTNEFGTEPLQIGAAKVESAASGEKSGSPAALTFEGQSSVSIPPGAMVISDPAAVSFPALSDLAVTMFLPAQQVHTLTQHSFANTTNTMADGNQFSAAALTDTKPFSTWYFLKGIEVPAPTGSSAIVCFGDSITDGSASTKDGNARWPDVLAKRLQADKSTARMSVLNEGIGGNRLLHDGAGPSALARFDRDVIAQPGVRFVIILEGINDIGHAADPVKPYDIINANDLKFALQQLIDRAHAHGIKVIGATLTPYGKAKYESPAGEELRKAENEFIRHSGQFDGVIDFDKLTADSSNPGIFNPAYDSGDSLHPKDAGYKAMGDGIDLKLFQR